MSASPSRVTRRPSLRLPGRNYARVGLYLVTVVILNRGRVLSEIIQSTVLLTSAGDVVIDAFGTIVQRLPTVTIDSYVIMLDHVHLIVCFSTENVVTLGQVVGALKGLSAKRINELWRTSGPLWQRGYHDRVIRNASELASSRRYLENNPHRWSLAHAIT
jgi:putative transposase